MIKEINGFEGLYSIYDNGEIYSHIKEKFLKPTLHKDYLAVRLYKERKPEFLLVHRLVALHFVPNPENKPKVNHKDGNKLNNSSPNLEWVTDQENSLHSWNLGLSTYTASEKRRIATSKKCRKFNEEEEKQIRKWWEGGVQQKDIAEFCNCSRQLVYRIVNRKHKV